MGLISRQSRSLPDRMLPATHSIAVWQKGWDLDRQPGGGRRR